MTSNALSDMADREANLLLACSRTFFYPDVTDRIRGLLRSDLDWDYFLRAAQRHGVAPLLYSTLDRICPDAVPAASLNFLRSHFRFNGARNLLLAAELRKLFEFFETEGVVALPFKGPTLAWTVYRNLALRQSGDLDVLVRGSDFHRAKAMLLARGYRLWRDLTPSQEADHLRSNHAYTLISAENDIRVDLHWRFAQSRYSFALDPETLWDRRIRVPFCGASLPNIPPEELLIILCAHASKHHWERLAWICDIAELVRVNPELDWDEIAKRSAALNSERAVIVGLTLAEGLLDAPIPAKVSSKGVHDRRIKFLSSFVKRQMFKREHKPLGLVAKTALYVSTRERIKNKLPYLFFSLYTAFTPNVNDTTLLRLPAYLRFLYYPLRVMRLTKRSICETARRFVISHVKTKRRPSEESLL